jgi:hypothetical protein
MLSKLQQSERLLPTEIIRDVSHQADCQYQFFCVFVYVRLTYTNTQLIIPQRNGMCQHIVLLDKTDSHSR